MRGMCSLTDGLKSPDAPLQCSCGCQAVMCALRSLCQLIVKPACCRATRGALHWMGGVATLGLLFLTPFLKDTAHHCPKCGRNVAVAKLM